MASHTLLVLGGIGSGKLRYAQTLTGAAGTGDRVRRLVPADGADPAALAHQLTDAAPGEVLLVEELADWLSTGRGAGAVPVEELVAAVRASAAARLVLVSSEVGLSTTPTTVANRKLAEQLGTLNLALAEAADGVVLVVAGQPSWLKGEAAPVTTTVVGPDEAGEFTVSGVPVPDEAARSAATAHLATLGPVGLGGLAEVVRFAAATQGVPVPRPWADVRVLVLHGDHPGAQAAAPPRWPSSPPPDRPGWSWCRPSRPRRSRTVRRCRPSRWTRPCRPAGGWPSGRSTRAPTCSCSVRSGTGRRPPRPRSPSG